MPKDYHYNYKSLVQRHKDLKKVLESEVLKVLPHLERVKEKFCAYVLSEGLDVEKGAKGIRQDLENIRIILIETEQILNEHIKDKGLSMPAVETVFLEKVVSNYKNDIDFALSNLKSCHIEARNYLVKIEKKIDELLNKDQGDPQANKLLACLLEADQLRRDLYKGSIETELYISIKKCLSDIYKDPEQDLKIIYLLEGFYEHGIFTKYYTEEEHESYFIKGLSYAYEQTEENSKTYQLLGDMYPEYIKDFNE